MEATPATTELQASVGRLERQNRRLSAMTAIIGLALVLSFLVPRSTLSARRFTLYDGDNNQWAMWRVQDQQPALILQDSAGRWRALMRVEATSSEMLLSLATGAQGVMARALESGSSVALHDSQGRPRVLLTATDEGGRLVFFDESGNTIAAFPTP